EREQAYVREQVDARRAEVSKQQVDLAEKRTRPQFLQDEISRAHGVELRDVDWRYELWMAGRPPEGLKPLDLEDEGDEGSSAKSAPATTRTETPAGASAPAAPVAV